MNGISATKYCHSNHNRLRALFFSVFFLHAQHRGSRSTKTEKTKKKQAEAENNELKTNTELHPVVFAYLAENRRACCRCRSSRCRRSENGASQPLVFRVPVVPGLPASPQTLGFETHHLNPSYLERRRSVRTSYALHRACDAYDQCVGCDGITLCSSLQGHPCSHRERTR